MSLPTPSERQEMLKKEIDKEQCLLKLKSIEKERLAREGITDFAFRKICLMFWAGDGLKRISNSTKFPNNNSAYVELPLKPRDCGGIVEQHDYTQCWCMYEHDGCICRPNWLETLRTRLSNTSGYTMETTDEMIRIIVTWPDCNEADDQPQNRNVLPSPLVVKKLLTLAEQEDHHNRNSISIQYYQNLFENALADLSNPKYATIDHFILDEYPKSELPIGFEEFNSRIYASSKGCYGVSSHIEKSFNIWQEKVEHTVIMLYTL